MTNDGPDLERALRALQRGVLTEAVRDIVGLEYGEDELKPLAAALVVYGPKATVAVWDVDLENDCDLTPVQAAGVLTSGMAAVCTYLVEAETQAIRAEVAQEEEEEEQDE